MTDIQQALDLIARGTDDIIKLEELEERLKLGRPLRVKVGFDPTAPDLHWPDRRSQWEKCHPQTAHTRAG